MNYELAKKLKDARFPQPNKGGFYLWIPMHKTPTGVHSAHWKFLFTKNAKAWKYEYVYAPTLSELIEACGLPFGLDCNVKGYWYARQAHHSESIHTNFCSTPEEAVANLWLELNKK